VERVAVVTGANRGIGREVVRQLAGLGIRTVLAGRDPAKATEAAAELEVLGLPVVPGGLDVTDEMSVEALFGGLDRLDVLVNNAGILVDEGTRGRDADLDLVAATLETNLFGPWRCARAAIPLMERNGYGRIVNVSTGMGQLSDMGGGTPGYRVSKTALNALTRILAAELRGSGVLVNSMCPGWVRTDMGGAGAPRSVEEGADTALWLATLPDDGPTGGFFRNRKPIAW
jgi:NAD(P)-dependent dehydrogenase (short-subunit alcohol dehydrogenase family)